MVLGLTGRSLAINAVLAVIGGGLSFALFYYLPANLGSIASPALPAEMREPVSSILSQLMPAQATQIGLLIAVVVFIAALLRGSKAYGPLVAIDGILFAAYFYTLFQGGIITIKASLPAIIAPGTAEGMVSLDITNILYFFLIPPLLTIVKGLLITMKDLKASPKEAPAPVKT